LQIERENRWRRKIVIIPFLVAPIPSGYAVIRNHLDSTAPPA
jgi:hypothetical protein